MAKKREPATEKTAAEVIQHYFGTRPKSVSQIHGGLANFVFDVKVRDKELVVRISNRPGRLQFFLKEQWAVRKVREFKVPVPEILEVGNEVDGRPYMVLEKIAGRSADQCTDRVATLRRLAEYGRIINSIPTTGFGHVFDWSKNKLSRNHSWVEFLESELGIEGRIALFRKEKVFGVKEFHTVLKTIEALKRLDFKPRLNHGDLRLKNVLLDDAGEIKAIIDWENCISGPAPEWELSIALHDLSIDEKEVFLESYGISLDEFKKRSAAMKVLNILNYSRALEKAVRARDRKRVEYIKARLNGFFDLFVLK